jgi:hypothetical protein
MVLTLTLVVAIGLIASLTWIVVQREGNLAWDDADYLRRGLRIARLCTANGGLDLSSAIGQTLRERPKPPLLVAWIELVSLVTGRGNVLPLIVASSIIPYSLLILGVVVIAGRLFGRGAILPAVLGLACSPMSLSFGAKVMVETFLSLWILLVYAAAALLLERPSKRRGLMLGSALALAMMTKLTVALLLPASAFLFLLLYFRRYPLDRAAASVALWVLLPLSVIAGPWYLWNGGHAVGFALFSSRYNLVAEGRGDITPALDRITALIDQLVGWPLFVVLLVAAATSLRRQVGGGERVAPAATDFVALTMAGTLSGAVILLIPAYFDPRFLLPIWPSLAVCLGGWLGGPSGREGPARAVLTSALLGACLVASAGRLAREGRTTTYWEARRLIDDLVAHHRAATIGNVGDCGDWNVCKTGLINELRATPTDCFVLHDLSKDRPGDLERRVGKLDALVVLDRAGLPPSLLSAAPGLNRAYGSIDEVLRKDSRFRRIELDLAGLPPLSVYVRRR